MIGARRRGSYLALALFFTVVSTTAALGMIEILPSEQASLKMARLDESSTRTAEAGIRDTMAWMSRQLFIGNEPLTSATASRSGSLDDWDWQVVIRADAHTPPNPRTGIRMYHLMSTASYQGSAKRRISCWVQGGEPLAKYAFLSNAPDHSNTWDLMLTGGIRTVDGPVHSEGKFRFVLVNDAVGSDFREINGKLTCSATGSFANCFDFESGGGYDTPSSDEDFDRLNTLGKSGFQGGVDPLPAPMNSAQMAEAAWGAPPPATPTPGVYVAEAGGIYMAGDVTSITLSVVDGNAVTTIVQGTTTSTVTRVYDTPVGGAGINQRLVDIGGTQTVVDGLGSGVYFCNGDIASLVGKVKGKCTIASDFSANKNLTVVGNLTRDDTVEGDEPAMDRDGLGLVGSKILISNSIPDGSHVFLYASMLAYDEWRVVDHMTRGRFAGTIFGGIQSIANAPRDGGFSGGVTTSGMTGPGFYGTPKIVSDRNMIFNPPPMYPSSEQGKLVLRYWKEMPVE